MGFYKRTGTQSQARITHAGHGSRGIPTITQKSLSFGNEVLLPRLVTSCLFAEACHPLIL